MTTTPPWATVGAEVQAVGGGKPTGPVLTITRVTATKITLSDGTKWRTKDLTQFGTPAYDPSKVYGGSTVRMIEARESVERRARYGRAASLAQAASRLSNQYGSAGGREDDVVAAILAIAPDLGLTVTLADGEPVPDPEVERLTRVNARYKDAITSAVTELHGHSTPQDFFEDPTWSDYSNLSDLVTETVAALRGALNAEED
jgi:hypothetical protein